MNYEQYKELGNYEPQASSNIAQYLGGSIIGMAANEASHILQFPVQTSNLNFLALCSIPVSMCYKIEVDFGDFVNEMPCCISAISEQEPSSRKSPLFGMLTGAINTATKEANARRAQLRNQIDPKNKKGESELELNDHQKKAIADNHPIYVTTSDPTIAAINNQVSKTGGWFAEYSTEQDLLNNIVGGKYEKEGTGSSMGLLLSAWSGENSGQSRVSRDAFVGVTHGTIITCSQHGALNTFIQNGDTNGLSVRALVVDEESMVGYRKHLKPNIGNKCISIVQQHIKYLVSSAKSMQYEDLKSISPTSGQIQTLLELEAELEEEKRLGGSLHDGFARQLYGKLDSHVWRVAVVIHVMSYAGTIDEISRTLSDDSFEMALQVVLECFRGMLDLRRTREIGTESLTEQVIFDFLSKQATKQAPVSIIKNKVGRSRLFKTPQMCVDLCDKMAADNKLVKFTRDGKRPVVYYRLEDI